MPLNALPSDVSLNNWGEYIGFEKNPQEYFDLSEHAFEQYYSMDIVASTALPRSEYLGPRYSAADNPGVSNKDILPIFGNLNFNIAPIEVESIVCH